MLRGRKYELPGEQTLGFLLLQLTAISGEFPAALLDRLPGGASYKTALVYKLKQEGLLRTFYKDGLRTWRLTIGAKRCLLQQYPQRFTFYLTGKADTNCPKSEITRRIRLCRIASAYLTMLGAEVLVYRDSKPQFFKTDGGVYCPALDMPAFYSSREIKEIGAEAVKIRGARLVGVLLSKHQVFVTYNSNTTGVRWDYRAEMRAQALIKNLFCGRSRTGYSLEMVSGLLLGDSMEPLYTLFTGADSGSRCFFLLDGSYEHFYYLTNDHYGETVLKLLCDQGKTEELNSILMQGLGSRDMGGLIEHDAVDRKGNPVLFGYFMDMPRMLRFASALQLQERQGTMICFDYQEQTLSRCFGEQIKFQTISFEKFEGRFYR